MSNAPLIFELAGGFMFPRLPLGSDGQKREIDNIRYFDEQATAGRLGVPVATLSEVYGEFLQEMGAGDQRIKQADAALEILRGRYYWMDDVQFSHFREICRAKNFNPWGDHIWPYLRPGKFGEQELQVGMKADGFLAVALRTGELEKIVGPRWCGPDGKWTKSWTQDCPPTLARVGILRRGMKGPVYANARWSSYAPPAVRSGRADKDDCWMKMADRMLAKCATCLAIRGAFSDQLDGVYAQEEMAQARSVVSDGARPSVAPPVAKPATAAYPELVQDESIAPQTMNRFRLVLMDCGIGNGRHMEQTIEKLKADLPHMYGANTPAFYAAAVQRVRSMPERYGVVAVEA